MFTLQISFDNSKDLMEVATLAELMNKVIVEPEDPQIIDETLIISIEWLLAQLADYTALHARNDDIAIEDGWLNLVRQLRKTADSLESTLRIPADFRFSPT